MEYLLTIDTTLLVLAGIIYYLGGALSLKYIHLVAEYVALSVERETVVKLGFVLFATIAWPVFVAYALIIGWLNRNAEEIE